MSTRPGHACARRATTEALARSELASSDRPAAEQHLASCQSCRATFRQLTAERFPSIRNFTIVDELGRGGFGVVYKAVHHSKERFEALKLLFGKTSQRAAYFQNEVHLAARLRHPNIATLYDARLTTPPLYYTMEFVEGKHLDAFFHSHNVSLEERIGLVQTVAGAVEYAHNQGVIHRDLKPQNILIDALGQPRIVDFGIAKRFDISGEDENRAPSTTPRTEGALGTFGYMAPEQLAGEQVDARADIYGLGALLFHVITGQPARFAPNVERLTAVLRERQVSRADGLAAIIACCVHADPARRYPSAAALVHDLENYLSGRAVDAHKDPTPGQQVARLGTLMLRRYPLPVQAVAVALIAILLTATFWIAQARWLVPSAGSVPTSLIAITPSTIDAIRSGQIATDLPGVDWRNRKSFRVLYGHLMEKLAAVEPRAVIWDYYFPDAQPQFDPAFVRGAKALAVPVIVGTNDMDVNGEPVISPAIRDTVRGWGLLRSRPPKYLKEEIDVPLAAQRSFNPPMPSLALAGFAAAGYPDCDADIRISPQNLTLRYRRREVAPEEPRWESHVDEVPVFEITTGGPNHPVLGSDDRSVRGRFRLDRVGEWASRSIPLEKVLSADTQQLRKWFAGRAILVGQMLPGSDPHTLGSGDVVFGCQIQATMLESLLSGRQLQRLGRSGLALRVCLWSFLAAALVHLVPVRGTWPLRLVTITTVILMGTAVMIAVRVSLQFTSLWAVEATVLVCAVLAAGGPVLLLRLLHERQLRLTPGPAWSAEGKTASTTVLADADADETAA